MNFSENNDTNSAQVYQEDKTLEEMFLKTTGRLNRLRYLKRSILLMIVPLLLSLPFAVVFSDSMGNLTAKGEIIVAIIDLVMLFPGYCLDVRRLHDMDKDDTLAKINFVLSVVVIFSVSGDPFEFSTSELIVSLLIIVILIYMLFVPGTNGENKYGPDPLG